MAWNILIVDDSCVVRTMIRKTLALAGLDVGQSYEAGNGSEGLKLLSEQWVDLAFVDINMPVMNGEEMITQVRKNPVWADLPIIVVSTEGSQTRIERLQAQGVQFIHKPFSPEAVRQTVQGILGASHEPLAN